MNYSLVDGLVSLYYYNIYLLSIYYVYIYIYVYVLSLYTNFLDYKWTKEFNSKIIPENKKIYW